MRVGLIKYAIWGVLLSCMSILHAVDDLGTLTIEANQKEEGFSEVFTAPEYIEQRSYLQKAPAQKRLTTQEAMFIPGVQGDPLKALRTLSGVTSSNDMSGELYIYGSKPQESDFSLNHLPIGYVYHGLGIHSVISPDAIDQIDAYLGGFDTTYGEAMGGVIDITPRYPRGDNSGFVHVGIYDASGGMDIKVSDKLNLYVGARRSYYDLLLQAVGKSTGTLDEDSNTTYTEFPNYWDMTTMLDYRYDNFNIFSFELLSAKDDLDIATYDNIEKDPEATGEIANDSGFTSLGLRHRFEGLNYSAHTLAYYNYNFANVELFDDYYFKSVFQRMGLFHQSDYELENHLISFGGEFQHLDYPLDLNISRPPSPNDPDYDFTSGEKIALKDTIIINSLSLFLQDTWSITDDWRLRYGLRYSSSDYQEFQNLIDPRLSLVYQLGGFDALSFSAGTYSQIPEGFKTNEDFGSTTLSYERSNHYMFAYNHSDDTMEWGIQPFYKTFYELAIDVRDANGSTVSYASKGEGDAYGIDLSAKYRDGRYYAFIAYTYLKASRQVSTDDPQKYPFYGDIPHTLQMVGSVRFWDNWAFSILSKYSTGKLYTPVMGTYVDPVDRRIRPIYDDLFSKRLPDYFTLNLKIAQQIKLGRGSSISWSFELMNATNHQNVTDIRYDDNYDIKGYKEQLPLLPWLDVTYRF